VKVFLPFTKDLNPYLEEITRHSIHRFEYGCFKDWTSKYDIVNIHWPEAIFNWKEPTDEQLQELEKSLLNWKIHSRIVYTKHDLSRHKGMTPNFTRLFELIERNSDLFIHLGKFSKELYMDKYPNAQHEIVVHPLYESSLRKFTKIQARNLLGISSDAIVVIVPGSIRNLEERRLVLSSFKGLKIENKVLIATNMRSEIKYDFPGRVRLKPIFNVRDYVVKKFKSRHKPPRYLFTYDKLNTEDLSLRMAAADIVLIPRLKILNSGILFLGLTFNKVIIGPEKGNITEHLKFFKMPFFNPNSTKSVISALEKGIALVKSNYIIKEEDKEWFDPINVAKEMDKLLLKLI
jgi:hypothetical protein